MYSVFLHSFLVRPPAPFSNSLICILAFFFFMLPLFFKAVLCWSLPRFNYMFVCFFVFLTSSLSSLFFSWDLINFLKHHHFCQYPSVTLKNSDFPFEARITHDCLYFLILTMVLLSQFCSIYFAFVLKRICSVLDASPCCCIAIFLTYTIC